MEQVAFHDGAPWQAKVAQQPFREAALMAQIVNSVEYLGVSEGLDIGIIGLEVGGDQSRMPVVAVDYVGAEVPVLGGLKHGSTEESEPPSVVFVAVDLLTIKIAPMLDEKDWNLRREVSLPQGYHLSAGPHWHL